MFICDCQNDARIFSLEHINNEDFSNLPLLKQWDPHPSGMITDVIVVDDIEVFGTSSDTGDISLYSFDGIPVAKFGQRATWPIHDPRSSHHPNVELLENSEQEDSEQENEQEINKYNQINEITKNDNNNNNNSNSPPHVPSYAELHPPYMAKTLNPSNLRTYGFNLSPMKTRQTNENTEEKKREVK
jgi:hypothetical protein